MLAKRKQLLLAVEQRPEIQEILRAEPEVSAILRIAASYENARDRWYAYEALKQLSSAFVGWGAFKKHLTASRYYDAMIDAIDTLLPHEMEDSEPEDDVA